VVRRWVGSCRGSCRGTESNGVGNSKAVARFFTSVPSHRKQEVVNPMADRGPSGSNGFGDEGELKLVRALGCIIVRAQEPQMESILERESGNRKQWTHSSARLQHWRNILLVGH